MFGQISTSSGFSNPFLVLSGEILAVEDWANVGDAEKKNCTPNWMIGRENHHPNKSPSSMSKKQQQKTTKKSTYSPTL
jgi:hypothetical protein